jgi:hypothetical protein
VSRVGGATKFEVQLDETSGESNGAAYLVHMLLSQQIDLDKTGRFPDQALRLKPVKLTLSDTGESCAVVAFDGGLRVTTALTGRYPTAVTAESRHVIDVTKLRLAGRFLITGPLRDKAFWHLLGDIATRKVIIKGLLTHYLNTLRFLWVVNLRGK